MTGHASLRDAQKRLVQILRLDAGAFSSGDLVGEMALIASQPRVFALQQVACFLVIELIGIPLDQRETRPIVIGMATHAFLAGALRNVIGAV